jgi:hypothetical protein
VNDRASLLTRIQKTFLDYHFKVEQEAGSATFSFFSFNGTALDTKETFSKNKKQNYAI